jgi:hypothetical protein
MRKVVTLVLVLFVLAAMPFAQTQEELSTGKELSVLLSGMVIEYQAAVHDFIFEHKLSAGKSSEDMLIILEEKTDEMIEIVNNLDMQRVNLIQDLQSGEITKEEFLIEMSKLTSEVDAAAHSLSILGEKISEIIATIPEELQGRALALAEKFNQLVTVMSEMGLSISFEMGGQGNKNFEIPKIGLPEDKSHLEGTGSGQEDKGQPEDTGSGQPEDKGQPEDTGSGQPEDKGQPEDTGSGREDTERPGHKPKDSPRHPTGLGPL